MAFLKYGLTFLAGIIVGVIGVIVAGLAYFNANISVSGLPQTGALDPYLQGEMNRFVSLESPPSQSDAPLESAIGETLTLDAFHGQIVMVNYWASWCAPCIEEMPRLDDIAGAFNSEDFQLVIVALDNEIDASRRAYERLELSHLDFLHAEQDAAYPFATDASRMVSLPLTVIYDREGRELGRLAGSAEWDLGEVQTLIEGLTANF